MLRFKITSNVTKFLKQVDNLQETVGDMMNSTVESFLISAFEVVLENSPADTGSFLMSWTVYKHGGAYKTVSPGISAPHKRYDMAGRLETHAAAKQAHMSVLIAELEALNLSLLDENRKQVTIGISNAVSYGNKLEYGLYDPKPPLINLTPDGFSVQAPSGILNVAISEVSGGSEFGQFLKVGGSS